MVVLLVVLCGMVILLVYCVSKLVIKVYVDFVWLLFKCNGIWMLVVLFGFVEMLMSDVFFSDKLFFWIVNKVVLYICCKFVVGCVEVVFFGLLVFGMCLLLLLLLLFVDVIFDKLFYFFREEDIK